MSDNKGTWWSVTAYNDDIKLIESGEFPSYVKKVYGGREECPETKGCIQLRSQQRMKKLKEWLPTAHFEVARQKDCLVRYAMKEETAIGPKTVRENNIEHITVEKIMMKLADEWDIDVFSEYLEEYKDDVKEAFKSAYWHTVRSIFSSNPDYRKVCHIFARADVITLWDRTRGVWLKIQDEANSITASANPGSDEVAKIISELVVQCQSNDDAQPLNED